VVTCSADRCFSACHGPVWSRGLTRVLEQETLARTTFCYPDSVFEPTHFGVALRMSLVGLAEADDDKDLLDDYIEAQVHGPLLLAHDVEALVLDPCFRDTDVQQWAEQLGCPLEWHHGFRLSVDELQKHPDYRGPEYTEVPSTSSWASPLPKTGTSTQRCSVTRQARVPMTTRPSNAYGTTSRASARLRTPFSHRASR